MSGAAKHPSKRTSRRDQATFARTQDISPVGDSRSMSETITVASRFRGPVRSGNGGVSAGLAAQFLDGSVTVRIRRPPPIGVPLEVRFGESVQVIRRREVILEAKAGSHPVDPPVSAEALSETFIRGTMPVAADHLAPECFVCGNRSDGLRIAPRHVPGTELWATVWEPDTSVSSRGVNVDDHVVWGALDCPAGFAVAGVGVQRLEFFPALTDITAVLHRPVPVGQPLAVIGWKIGGDNRRVNGGTAIFDMDGGLLASAYAQHAPVPLGFASD